ncbi:MAG TPA: site-specific integrase, partial [Candidatus Limnocylindrales bacterium]|nr:site-specific integrase [Candidatus Limnocylindrales bacterium]
MTALVRLAPPGPLTRSTTLEALAPRFLTWLQFVRRRSENTIRAYEADLRVFLAFAHQAELVQPEDVNFRHLEFYLGWLQTERHAKPATANRHLHALRAFWRWARREGITTTDPAADTFTLPTPTKLPDYLSIAEQERVLEVLGALRTPLGRRDHAVIATALLTGLRCSELVH